jgi:hypothetical protein
MPDLTAAFESPELEAAFQQIVDREGKIPAALEELGPVCDRDVVLLDAGRGFRERELAGLGARVTAVRFDGGADEAAALSTVAAMPEGCADTVVVPWSEHALPGSTFIGAADRLLRARGKLLLIHDYGRDDVWSLWPDRRDRVVEWSIRKGPFLGDEFRVRVIHCRWTFDSIEQARELLMAGFGDRGAALADEIKRPRLEYQVAVYHRWAPAARASLRFEGEQQTG